VICERVQLDRTIGEAWLNKNVLESWQLPVARDGSSKLTKAAETKMEQWLRDQPSSPVRRKEDVWENKASKHVLGELGRKLSRKAFTCMAISRSEGVDEPWTKEELPTIPLFGLI
jgi:hypothetical protein